MLKNQKNTKIPEILYGTAWKEDLTEDCVLNALNAGYRAIDTANQRKHYYEEGVGSALARAYSQWGLKREDLFLQTKFTFARGQDDRKPYDPHASFKIQVQQSFESSLQHLKTDYLDSYVLHGPSVATGLIDSDWETWEQMEEICRNGGVGALGISNVNYEQLVELHDKVKIKPRFVQNRCFAETHWDKAIREFCLQKDILYQGFSLLTANWKFLGGDMLRPEGRNIPHLVFSDSSPGKSNEGLHPEIQAIARQTNKNIQQIIFKFSEQIGMIPLTGTRSVQHMKSNLEIHDFKLSDSQIKTLENIAFL